MFVYCDVYTCSGYELKNVGAYRQPPHIVYGCFIYNIFVYIWFYDDDDDGDNNTYDDVKL